MKTSKSAKEKIKEFEGLRTKAYRCPAGVWTIGYGHTGDDVTKGMEVTEAQADALLDADLRETERLVMMTFDGVNLRQCQWDALVSFTFNVGIGNVRSSTLLRKVRSYPDNPAIRGEFIRWVYSKGKKLPGLVRRREWESRRYFGEE